DDVTFTDLIRGELSFKAGSVPDFVIVRGNGQPLYTLTNPVDDALTGITHVLRGEDLLSSTPRQVVMYRALLELGVASVLPEFGHMPYVMGEGNKKLSKRDPESNLFAYRDAGFVPEGLLNYLALLGWSIAPDRDVFSREEMIAAFDVRDVNPNPARFDAKKAESINASHVRLLEASDFRDRTVPYLHAAGIVEHDSFDALPAGQQDVLTAAAPLVQERINKLGEAPGMLGFLLVPDTALEIEEDALGALRDEAPAVLDAAAAALEALPADAFATEAVQEALQAAVVDGLGLKPRFAFTPLRVAVSGRRVSPPLFESMEILGKDSTLARLRALRSRV
ncbi:MAG: glutamate--tRNA ligase family protein, partial [Actinomycetota bacterium]|nr:glutamate--tRNA ligase family protein [Actinomycetota bacterium]